MSKMKTKAAATHLTVIFRDDTPMIHCDDCPSYRRVTIALSPEQIAQLHARLTGSCAGVDSYEAVSRCFLEEPTP